MSENTKGWLNVVVGILFISLGIWIMPPTMSAIIIGGLLWAVGSVDFSTGINQLRS